MSGFDRISQVFQRAGSKEDDFAEPRPSIQPTFTISIRVTAEEKKRLEYDAAGMSRSAYIRERLFGSDVNSRKTRGKHPVKDFEALARVLGRLGKLNLAQAFDDLSWAERNGKIVLEAKAVDAIQQACTDISEMRDDLVTALGLKPERKP